MIIYGALQRVFQLRLDNQCSGHPDTSMSTYSQPFIQFYLEEMGVRMCILSEALNASNDK